MFKPIVNTHITLKDGKGLGEAGIQANLEYYRSLRQKAKEETVNNEIKMNRLKSLKLVV